MRPEDTLRGTGRTTRQMLEAPADAVFVCCHEGALEHDKWLARKHGRDDLRIVRPSWLDSFGWHRLLFTDIVVDHAARLSDIQKHHLELALLRIRRTP